MAGRAPQEMSDGNLLDEDNEPAASKYLGFDYCWKCSGKMVLSIKMKDGLRWTYAWYEACNCFRAKSQFFRLEN